MIDFPKLPPKYFFRTSTIWGSPRLELRKKLWIGSSSVSWNFVSNDGYMLWNAKWMANMVWRDIETDEWFKEYNE